MSTKYELIDAEKAHHAVVDMCAWLRVSRSGFYERRSRPLSATAERRERLKPMTEAVFAANHDTYGYRRVHAVLARSAEDASPELVRQLMRELGLEPVQPRHPQTAPITFTVSRPQRPTAHRLHRTVSLRPGRAYTRHRRAGAERRLGYPPRRPPQQRRRDPGSGRG
ncbi:IS3 family transposase [Actinomadura sp. WAC 06369]|uniref:IS3 family transposase n=1 Tax=Actinomadura sp. WAC 06369 TaxID=2203193 RepID=UPI000F7A4056|nr:IS3 family transposase [Actinomadura sp. WAC 06369]RSN69766.1 hypothetical protein DMH08_07815 [Actinomadura sp. WAC 06369]